MEVGNKFSTRIKNSYILVCFCNFMDPRTVSGDNRSYRELTTQYDMHYFPRAP